MRQRPPEVRPGIFRVMFRRLSIAVSGALLLGATADAPLLRVGPLSLSLAVAQRRADELPPARVAQLDGSAERYVKEVLVPELLYDAHTESRDVKFDNKTARDAALAFGLERALARSLRAKEEQVEEYYQANWDAFVEAEAILVWRIVAEDEATARQILSKVEGDAKGVETWSQLARDHSRDDATRMRRGSLGFVRKGGHTDVHQVRVNPAIFDAVSPLKDGELLGEPFEDGEHYSVLWRRGSRPERSTPLDQARRRIRSFLEREQLAKQLQTLLDGLKRQRVSLYAPDTLELIEYPFPEVETQKPRSQAAPPSGDPEPKETPRGER